MHDHLAACNFFGGPVACATWNESHGRGHISVISLETRRADNRQRRRSTRIFRGLNVDSTPKGCGPGGGPSWSLGCTPNISRRKDRSPVHCWPWPLFWPAHAADCCASKSLLTGLRELLGGLRCLKKQNAQTEPSQPFLPLCAPGLPSRPVSR